MSTRDLTILGCSSQQPTRLRNHGAYLLRWNKEGFLFDPGEGTQRQFIFADTSPTSVTRIFISHFHGDHCLGFGSMLMRLNLDRVTHPIHCYYPASGKVYFDRLRFGTIYHDHIQVIEHPVEENGIVHSDDEFTVEAQFLDHGIDNLGWRIKEKDTLKYDKEKLEYFGIKGPVIKTLEKKKTLKVGSRTVHISDVSYERTGDVFACVIDTKLCPSAFKLAQGAKLLLCESTYLDMHKDLAISHNHMTAKQAAKLAKQASVQKLILTHFSARYKDLELFRTEAQSVFKNTDVADDFRRFLFPKDDY